MEGISKRQTHTIPPVYDGNSQILILGSFPSVKSREYGFFYGNPQNRFWRVVSSLVCEPLPLSIDDKKQLLIRHGIALWDVIAKCNIVGSSDSSITDVEPVDIDLILKTADIKKIFVNGRTAEKLYCRYLLEKTKMQAVSLPSTSPANAGYSLEKLLNEWKIITEYIR